MIEEKMNRDHSSIIFLCSCNVGMPHWVYPLRPSVSHKSKTGPTFSQICFLVKTKDCIFLSHRNRFWMDLPSFLALCSNQTPHGRVRVPFFTNNLYVCSLLEDSWPKPVSEEQEEKAACKLYDPFLFFASATEERLQSTPCNDLCMTCVFLTLHGLLLFLCDTRTGERRREVSEADLFPE